MPVVDAELQQANAGGSIRKRRFGMDCRVKPGHDGRTGKNEKRFGGETPTDARLVGRA
jgi:hypothetical protein